MVEGIHLEKEIAQRVYYVAIFVLRKTMEEVPLHQIIITAHKPIISLSASEVMHLCISAYTSDAPAQTIESFLSDYNVDVDTCCVLLPSLKDSRNVVNVEDLQRVFVHACTRVSRVWTRPGNRLLQKSPVFYDERSGKPLPFLWLEPNDMGLPQRKASYACPSMTVWVHRQERRGDMMPFAIKLDGGSRSLQVHLQLHMDAVSDFCVKKVDTHKDTPNQRIVLVLTRNGGILIQCVHVNGRLGAVEEQSRVCTLIKNSNTFY
jgi:hypothetical protein